MKINSSYLFNLFNAANALASYYSVNAQSAPNVAFGNANANANHTFVLRNEYSEDGAYCDFDSCSWYLPPLSEFGAEEDIWQPVAFASPPNGSLTLTYDVCNGAGQSSVIYGHPPYHCADYSGATINVTSTLSGVMADIINNSAQSVQVIETNSKYRIVVTLFPELTNDSYPTRQPTNYFNASLPSREPTQSPTWLSTNQLRVQGSTQNSFFTGVLLLAATLGAVGICFVLLCLRYSLNKEKTMDSSISNANKILRNSCFGVFPRSSGERLLRNSLALETENVEADAKEKKTFFC